MTFPNDSTCAIKMEHSEEEISAALVESRQSRRHMRKLAETVAAYRLREVKNLQAVEKLFTWRRTYGYDRIAADDNQWANRPLSLTPEQFTQSLWSELNALMDAISIPEGDGFSQRAKSFTKENEQGTVNSTNAVRQSTVNLTDEESTMLKRLVKKRDLDAAHATVAPVDTAQYRSPRSLTPEIPSDVCLSMEKKNQGMEEKDEGR